MKKIFPILLITLFGCSQPDIQLKTIDAAAIKSQVESHKGSEAVLINFWATWCAPCIEEFPHIVELSHAYAGKGLKVYFVSADWKDKEDAVVEFLTEHGVSGLSFIKDEGNDNQFIRDIHEAWSGALPFTIIYDKNGDVSDHWENKKSRDVFEAAIKKAIGG